MELLQTFTSLLPPFHTGLESWALLTLRVIWGIVLLAYGLPMLKNPFHWMDMPKPSGFPGILQLLGAVSVFGGGLAMISGFLTSLAAFGLAFSMGIALFIHISNGKPFMKERPDSPGQSYETSLVYLAIAIMFIFVGPGRLSLDYLLFG